MKPTRSRLAHEFSELGTSGGQDTRVRRPRCGTSTPCRTATGYLQRPGHTSQHLLPAVTSICLSGPLSRLCRSGPSEGCRRLEDGRLLALLGPLRGGLRSIEQAMRTRILGLGRVVSRISAYCGGPSGQVRVLATRRRTAMNGGVRGIFAGCEFAAKSDFSGTGRRGFGPDHVLIRRSSPRPRRGPR